MEYSIRMFAFQRNKRSKHYWNKSTSVNTFLKGKESKSWV